VRSDGGKGFKIDGWNKTRELTCPIYGVSSRTAFAKNAELGMNSIENPEL
jgi:hypothetical protein